MIKNLALESPKSLRFSIGGFMGPTRIVEWVEGQLWLKEDPDGDGRDGIQAWQRCETPTQADWDAFHRTLETSDFWRWPRNSDDPHILDGTQWGLCIHWGNRRRSVDGSNAYPRGFRSVEKAIKALTIRKVQGAPGAFRLRFQMPGTEEQYEWDGRYLSFAAFGTTPRLIERLEPPLESWKDLNPILGEALCGSPDPLPVREGASGAFETLVLTKGGPESGLYQGHNLAPSRGQLLRTHLQGLLPSRPQG